MGTGLENEKRGSLLPRSGPEVGGSSMQSGIPMDHFVHPIRIWGRGEIAGEFIPAQNLRNAGQRVKVFLELPLRHEEEGYEVDGLVIEGIEVNSRGGASEGSCDLRNEIRRSVRYSNTKPDSCGHGGLAFFDRGGNGRLLVGLEFAGMHEQPDQFINCLPPVSRPKLREDLSGGENVTKCHTCQSVLVSRSKKAGCSRGFNLCFF